MFQESNILSKDNVDFVLKDFPGRINDWCEKYYQRNKSTTPKQKVCKVAVEIFSQYGLSEDYIRKRISKDYKEFHRVQNGKKTWLKSKITRLSEKASIAEKELANAITNSDN